MTNERLVEQLRAEAVVWRGVTPPSTVTVYNGAHHADLLDRAADAIEWKNSQKQELLQIPPTI